MEAHSTGTFYRAHFPESPAPLPIVPAQAVLCDTARDEHATAVDATAVEKGIVFAYACWHVRNDELSSKL